MASVYLETSFFSACVTTRTNPRPQGWRASSNKWWNEERGNYDLFASNEVILELSSPTFQNSEEALKMLRGVRLLNITNEVLDLAELLVKERLMPAPPISGDAMHIALATIHRVEYVLSWNVKHLANPNKRTHLAVFCMRLGLIPPLICTPDML